MTASLRPLSVHFDSKNRECWLDIVPLIDAIPAVDILRLPDHSEQPAEMLFAGMTFRVWLHATGHNSDIYSSFRQIFCNLDPTSLAVLEISVGAHLEGGEHLVPVIQAKLQLAAMLGQALDSVAFGWAPANHLMQHNYFIGMVCELRDGGAFPIFGLIDIAEHEPNLLATTGLFYFVQCEIELIKPDEMGAGEVTKRLFQLANHLIADGMDANVWGVFGLAQGEQLDVLPSHAGDAVIRAQITIG